MPAAKANVGRVLVTDREAATILAALRVRQAVLLGEAPILAYTNIELTEIATASGTLEPLTADEIDDLADRFGGA